MIDGKDKARIEAAIRKLGEAQKYFPDTDGRYTRQDIMDFGHWILCQEQKTWDDADLVPNEGEGL